MPAFNTKRTDHLINLKEIILQFLQGEPLGVIKIRLQVACAEWNKSCKSLYKSIPLDAENDPFITAILGSLNIKKNVRKTASHYKKLLLKSDSYHALLKNLYHDGQLHIGELLSLIDKAKPNHNWTIPIIVGALGSISLAIVIYINKKTAKRFYAWLVHTFPVLGQWVKKTLSLLRNLPLVAILYNCFGLVLSWYHTFMNGTITTRAKLSRLFFKTLTTGLDISAYVVSFFAAGVMSVPAALLSVLSSSTDIFQSVFTWIRSRWALQKLTQNRPQMSMGANWENIAEHERAKSFHQRDLNSVIIKLCAATLKTVAVGIWLFFPPSLLITIWSLTFIALIALLARTIILTINEASANALQKTIKHIKLIPSKELCPSNTENLDKLQLQQEELYEKELLSNALKLKLDQQQKRLDQREKELDMHQKVLDKRQKYLELTCNSTTKMLRGLKYSGCAPEILDARLIAPHPVDAENSAEVYDETTRVESDAMVPFSGAALRH